MSKNVSIVNDQPILIQLLLTKNQIDAAGIESVVREQGKRNCSLEEAMLFTQTVSEENIARAYAEYMKVPLVTPSSRINANDPDLKKYLPEKFCRENHVVPLSVQNEVLNACFLDPTDPSLIQELQLYTGLRVNVNVSTLAAIDKGLDLLYGAADTAKEMAQATQEQEVDISKQADEEVLDLDRIVIETKETKVIRLVNRIVSEAIREKASDIHLEPYENECKVRFRIDGVLNEFPPPPLSLYVAVISRLKILCKMDIAEKRVPQDGAFGIKVGEQRIDVRVSTIPTVHGEKMVMRILNKGAVPLDLATLGFDKRQCEDFLSAAQSPHGLLFVTGPTGSGKSTTLYATLNLIMSPKKNILTVEDPVEYKFAGINQVQVKPQVELTFARALRAFLRQDPDVIMVGEVRDGETAQICLRAALTGHFVLSTLHTNDALSATFRLMDMGIEPFLIASTLRLVEAQRLIRRLCPKCKEPYQPTDEVMEQFNVPKGTMFHRPKGCKECRFIGYKGRVGIFEVIRITPNLRDMIQDRIPLPKMREQVRKDGMQTLTDNGMLKVFEGLTSLEEIVNITLEGE